MDTLAPLALLPGDTRTTPSPVPQGGGVGAAPSKNCGVFWVPLACAFPLPSCRACSPVTAYVLAPQVPRDSAKVCNWWCFSFLPGTLGLSGPLTGPGSSFPGWLSSTESVVQALQYDPSVHLSAGQCPEGRGEQGLPGGTCICPGDSWGAERTEVGMGTQPLPSFLLQGLGRRSPG